MRKKGKILFPKNVHDWKIICSIVVKSEKWRYAILPKEIVSSVNCETRRLAQVL